MTMVLRGLIIASGFVLFLQCVWRAAWPTASRPLKHRVAGLGIISLGATASTAQHLKDPFVFGLPVLLVGLVWANYGMWLTNAGDKEEDR